MAKSNKRLAVLHFNCSSDTALLIKRCRSTTGILKEKREFTNVCFWSVKCASLRLQSELLKTVGIDKIVLLIFRLFILFH